MGKLNSQLGRRVYLDTNTTIYAGEGYETHAARIKFVLQGMTEGEITAVTSDLTVAEVLVKPKRDNNRKLELAYLQFFLPTKSFRNSAISRDVLETRGRYSRQQRPEAAGCDSFRLGDQRTLRFVPHQ